MHFSKVVLTCHLYLLIPYNPLRSTAIGCITLYTCTSLVPRHETNEYAYYLYTTSDVPRIGIAHVIRFQPSIYSIEPKSAIATETHQCSIKSDKLFSHLLHGCRCICSNILFENIIHCSAFVSEPFMHKLNKNK